MRDAPEVTMGAQTDEGYLVAEVRREQHFSVTGWLYTSKRAAELGNNNAIIAGGCLHDEIVAAIPELRPIVAMHLSDVETGEPMHAESNARYWLDPAGDFASAMKDGGRHCYYRDEAGLVAGDPDRMAAKIVAIVADSLRVEVDELPDRAEPEHVAAFIDSLRPRWIVEAHAAREWIDAHRTPASEPERVETFAHVLPSGLAVSAVLDGEGYREGVGSHYVYRVKVEHRGRRYRTTFGGSVADFNEGVIDTREAAWGILHELADFARYDSPEEYAEELGIEWSEFGGSDVRRWRAAHDAAMSFAEALEADAELIGA